MAQHMPDAAVVGVLGDGRGLLLALDHMPNATRMQEHEAQLMAAGCTEWTWKAGPPLRLRVYWPEPARVTAWSIGIATVLAVICVLFNDIHLAQTVGSGIGA